MIRQLDHLLSGMRLPNVAVSVIPAMTDYQVPTTNFVIFDRKVAHVETISAELTITQPRELVLYEQVFQQLALQALVGKPAQRLIHDGLQKRNATSA